MRDSWPLAVPCLVVWLKIKGWREFWGIRQWFPEVKSRRGVEVEANRLREIEEQCLRDFEES